MGDLNGKEGGGEGRTSGKEEKEGKEGLRFQTRDTKQDKHKTLSD